MMKRTIAILVAMVAMTVVMAHAKGKSADRDPKAVAKTEKKAEPKKVKVRLVSDIVDAHGMYVYGIAYSPVDSVVYMTEQMMLEGAQIHLRSKFLVARDELSNQLRDHMVLEGEKNRTCCVVYNKDINKLNKEYNKQREYYQKKGFLVKQLDQSRFTFKAVRTEYNEEGYAIEEKEVVTE